MLPLRLLRLPAMPLQGQGTSTLPQQSGQPAGPAPILLLSEWVDNPVSEMDGMSDLVPPVQTLLTSQLLMTIPTLATPSTPVPGV